MMRRTWVQEEFLYLYLWDSFSRISPLGRWIAEEGHGDPSKRAFEIYCDYGIHI
jgi:hypothetical protein